MIKIYNSLSRKKEKFSPGKKGEVNIFVCGPTVYDFAHLGHARTYIFYDMLVNYLKFLGCKVFYLQNITDIDDKIIQRAKEKNKSWREIARFFEKEYKNDMKDLKITSITEYARATSHIREIISQVERLLQKRVAYIIEGDGVYFNIKKFKDYGKLSRRTVQQAQDAVSRIDESVRKITKEIFVYGNLKARIFPKNMSRDGKVLGVLEGRVGILKIPQFLRNILVINTIFMEEQKS